MQGGGALRFTGASASLRGRANFGAFNSAKGALRNLAQAMAKEYAADGIHVGHVVIDRPIGGEKIKKGFPDYAKQLGDAGMIGLQGTVDAYESLRPAAQCVVVRGGRANLAGALVARRRAGRFLECAAPARAPRVKPRRCGRISLCALAPSPSALLGRSD